MRLTQLLRSTFVALAVLSAALPGCSKKDKPDAEVTAENLSADDAITEQYEAGTVTWAVQPDGKVKARIKSPDGAPIEDGVKGTLTVRPTVKDAKPVTAPLTFDAKAGVYTADIPKLDADLTEVGYELDVKGKPVKGAMHLPKGGTKELVATAKVTAEVKIPKDKKGPNGGIIQVAGDDLLEIVADQKSGETRVYVLDDDFKPVAVGKRKIKLGVVANAPETVELAAEPKGMFLYGKLNVKANPSKLTVVLYEPEVPDPVVVLCGYSPGAVIVATPGVVVLPLFVAVSWTPVIVVGAPPVVVVEPPPPVIVVGHKGKGKHGWGPGKVHIHIH
jgi:hypothetical protein